MACIKNIVVYGDPGVGRYIIAQYNIYMLYRKEKTSFHWI